MSRLFERITKQRTTELPIDPGRLSDVRQQLLAYHTQQAARPAIRSWLWAPLGVAAAVVIGVIVITGGQWWLSQQQPSRLTDAFLPETVTADELDDALDQLFRPQQVGEGRFIKTRTTNGHVTITEQHWLHDRALRSDSERSATTQKAAARFPAVVDSSLQTAGDAAQTCRLRWSSGDDTAYSSQPDCLPASFGQQYNFFLQPRLQIDLSVVRALPASTDYPAELVVRWTTDQPWKNVQAFTGKDIDAAYIQRGMGQGSGSSPMTYGNKSVLDGRFEHQAIVSAGVESPDSVVFQIIHSTDNKFVFPSNDSGDDQGSQLFRYTFSTGALQEILPDELPLQTVDEIYKSTFTLLLSVWYYRDQLREPQISFIQLHNRSVTQFQFTITAGYVQQVSHVAAQSIRKSTKRELSGKLNIWIDPHQHQIVGYQVVNDHGTVTEEQLLLEDRVLSSAEIEAALSIDQWTQAIGARIAERSQL